MPRKHTQRFEQLDADHWRMTCSGCEFSFISTNSVKSEKIAKDVCTEKYEEYHATD